MKHRQVSLEDYSKYSNASNYLENAKPAKGARLTDPVYLPALQGGTGCLGAVSHLMPAATVYEGHLHSWDHEEAVLIETEFEENLSAVVAADSSSVEGRLVILVLISLGALFGVPLLFHFGSLGLETIGMTLAVGFAFVALSFIGALVLGQVMQAGFAQYYSDETVA